MSRPQPSRSKRRHKHSLALFAGLCLFRCLNTLVVQSYFDPDEYWQTLEPAYCHVFYSDKQNDSQNPTTTTTTTMSSVADNALSLQQNCPGFTWEWKRRRHHDDDSNKSNNPLTTLLLDSMQGPVRSYLGVLPIWVYYSVVKQVEAAVSTRTRTTTTFFDGDKDERNSQESNDDKTRTNHPNNTTTYSLWWWWLIARGPMMVWAIFIAAPTDYAVWYAAGWLPNDDSLETKPRDASSSPLQRWCLFCHLFSWFGAFSLVRTLANGPETMLIASSIALMAPELLGVENKDYDNDEDASRIRQNNQSKRIQNNTSNNNSPRTRAAMAFFLGGLAAAIRVTALAIYVPLGVLLALQREFLSQRLLYLLNPCALFGGLGVAVATAVDRALYGFWTLPALGNVAFNAYHANLYGEHPWYWNVTAALPVVTGLLLPLVVWEIVVRHVVAGRPFPRGVGNLVVLAVGYLTVLSLNAHKEFRFILPILPMFCWLAGPCVARLCTCGSCKTDTANASARKLRWLPIVLLVVPNAIALAYLGLFHQSGAISVNRRIVQAAVQRYQQQQQQAAPDSTTTIRLPPQTTVSIFYLTGSCHATPLHSYLHAPPLQFQTVTLDCSPSCRTDPDAECQTESFHKNPAHYLEGLLSTTTTTRRRTTTTTGNERTTGQCTANDSAPECGADTTTTHVSPDHDPAVDYVVTMSGYLPQMTPILAAQTQLVEVARFPYHLNGLQITSHGRVVATLGDDFGNPSFRRYPIPVVSSVLSMLGGVNVEVSLDEMILLAPKSSSQ